MSEFNDRFGIRKRVLIGWSIVAVLGIAVTVGARHDPVVS